MGIKSELEKISFDLNLEFELQDWAIINASDERLREFIEYFNFSNEKLSDRMKCEVFELIIASYNEAMISDSITDEIETFFKNLLESNANSEIYEWPITYWKGLKGEEFPIGEVLNSYLFGKQ